MLTPTTPGDCEENNSDSEFLFVEPHHPSASSDVDEKAAALTKNAPKIAGGDAAKTDDDSEQAIVSLRSDESISASGLEPKAVLHDDVKKPLTITKQSTRSSSS
jgi:hypothetical protein